MEKRIRRFLILAGLAIVGTALITIFPTGTSQVQEVQVETVELGLGQDGITRDAQGLYVACCAFDPFGQTFCMVDTDKQNLEERLAEAAFLKGLNNS